MLSYLIEAMVFEASRDMLPWKHSQHSLENQIAAMMYRDCFIEIYIAPDSL